MYFVFSINVKINKRRMLTQVHIYLFVEKLRKSSVNNAKKLKMTVIPYQLAQILSLIVTCI